MQKHPHFELMLHDDDELAAVLGSAVTQRETIHEWPLSCVQRVRTAEGDGYIYKVQAPPTVEVDFYARARSDLLVSVRILEESGGPAALVMEEVEAPRLSDVGMDEPEMLAIAGELEERIAGIGGELPVMFDISTEERWNSYIGQALDDIRALIGDGSFRQVDLEQLERLVQWSQAPAVIEAIRSRTGYVHADLKADNILVAADGYRVLDWQRPIRGPVALDRAALLLSAGIDPLRHVPSGVVQLYHLLHIAWYGQAGRRWFAQGNPWFDGIIKKISDELARLQSE